MVSTDSVDSTACKVFECLHSTLCSTPYLGAEQLLWLSMMLLREDIWRFASSGMPGAFMHPGCSSTRTYGLFDTLPPPLSFGPSDCPRDAKCQGAYEGT